MHLESFIRTRKNIIFGMALTAISSLVGMYFLAPLYIELQISLFGQEAEATVLKVDTFERDDGDRAWTVDYINYGFEIPEGFVFTGVNEANSSETERLIGKRDASGNFAPVRVEYLGAHPEWHRLKGWGYGGLGPPGPLLWLILRICFGITAIGFAYVYAYVLLCRNGSERPSV